MIFLTAPRLAARSPCPQVLRKQKGPKKKRLMVVAWKRITRALRRSESKRGLPAGFALIVPHPHRTLELARRCEELELEMEMEMESPETEATVVATTCSETDTAGSSSGWSLV